MNTSDELIDLNGATSILIIDFDAIGDIVMLIPFLRALRKNTPMAKVTLVCCPHGREVLRNQGLVDCYYICNHRLASSRKKLLSDLISSYKVIKKINCHRFDIILEPRGDLRDILFMHFCNGWRKAGYTYTGGEYMMTDPVEPDEKVKHLIEDKMVFLRKLGCDCTDIDPIPAIRLTKTQIKENQLFRELNGLGGKTVIGIHPGASKELKKWKKYPELVKALNECIDDAFFLFFSEAGEERDIESIIKCAEDNDIKYHYIRGDIREYITRMALCNLVVCNDSSAAHIAAALGIEVHVLFGPVLPELSRPYSKADVHIYEKEGLPCRPCDQKHCTYGNKCLTDIPVDEVVNGVLNSSIFNK